MTQKSQSNSWIWYKIGCVYLNKIAGLRINSQIIKAISCIQNPLLHPVASGNPRSKLSDCHSNHQMKSNVNPTSSTNQMYLRNKR